MITEKGKEEILAAVKKYADKRSSVMDALRIAQRDIGYITKGDMEEIASMLGMTPVEVASAATFYTMYNVRKPVGRHHIQVCRNISCSLMGAEHIIAHIERLLNIKTGETTGDSRYTLSTVECLGSCGTAPMMQVNDDYYENLTREGVEEILKGFK
ncbi:MAG: NADH-quinone oxidoreductase subunit NuoE [Deltaproteobacteria bacterium]|nr:NADH-quinone oxidoreductase subunit NuoE [Deltaproteobacteria bacterium]